MSVTVTRLPSGLTVATDTMTSVETASVGVWVGVGTRDEPAGADGIAHLLEHMAFKGTTRRSARAIAEAIEDVGGHLNAYTGREQTAYYAKVLADDTSLALDIVADILQNSVFDPEELERERHVVLQEIGQAEDTPDDIVFDRFQLAAYPDQPLGKPVLGDPDVVARLGRDDLIQYLSSHYGPTQMVAVAAGRVDHQRFLDEVSTAFADLPARAGAAGAAAQYQGGVLHEDRDLEQVHAVLGFPAGSVTDPDYYAWSVYSTILGGGMSSRLFQEVREKRGLAYSIYSFGASYRDGGTLGIYVGTDPKDLAEVLEVTCTELALLGDVVSEVELRRAKAQLRAGTLMGREGTSHRAEALAQQLMVFGRVVPLAEQMERLEAVTAADIARLARSVRGTVPTVATVGPLAGVDPQAVIRRTLG